MHRTTNSLAGAITLATALALFAVPKASAATPEQACEAGKNQAAGKYSACLAKAEKSFVTSGDMTKYSGAVAKCGGKLVSTWNKLEFKALVKGATCPSSNDRDDVRDFVDACVAGVAEAVSGGTLPVDVVSCHDDLPSCNADLGTCNNTLADCEDDLGDAEFELSACDDAVAVCGNLPFERLAKGAQTTCYNDAGTSVACAGTGQDGELRAGLARFDVDNGDGTITDHLTGLMWEKLSDDGSIHDKDTGYLNHAGAFVKIDALNSAAFAGHNDWRLPNRRELDSIIDLGRYNPAVPPVFHQGCVASCTVLTCSCTRNHIYWSSSTSHTTNTNVWVVNSIDGDIYEYGRAAGDSLHVRAVRSVY
jgi:hypothetical protein